MTILYEVTGYQGRNVSYDFWDQQRDFEELGQSKLIKPEKNELLLSTRRASKRKRITIEEAD